MPKKYYVVWAGRKTGIFTDWSDTKRQVDQFPQARYKSFKTRAEAEAAFASGAGTAVKKRSVSKSPAKPSGNSSASFDVEIYCDGASMPNPGEAGSGLALYRKGALAELWFGLYNPKGTNNTAELNALHQALLKAKAEIAKHQSVQIKCDSLYAIKCLSVWAYDWKKRGWTKQSGAIKNLAIIKEAHALYEGLKKKVVVSHVKAHVGIEGNELADRMTVYAIDQQNQKFTQYSGPLDVQKILGFRSG